MARKLPEGVDGGDNQRFGRRRCRLAAGHPQQREREQRDAKLHPSAPSRLASARTRSSTEEAHRGGADRQIPVDLATMVTSLGAYIPGDHVETERGLDPGKEPGTSGTASTSAPEDRRSCPSGNPGMNFRVLAAVIHVSSELVFVLNPARLLASRRRIGHLTVSWAASPQTKRAEAEPASAP